MGTFEPPYPFYWKKVAETNKQTTGVSPRFFLIKLNLYLVSMSYSLGTAKKLEGSIKEPAYPDYSSISTNAFNFNFNIIEIIGQVIETTT